MSDEPVDQAIAREIEVYIRKLPSRFRASAIFFWLTVFVTLQLAFLNFTFSGAVSGVLNALMGVVVGWGALNIPGGLSLEMRHSTFFRRNRDQILLLLLGSIIGALLATGLPEMIKALSNNV
jgi:hypothetical protein